MLRGRVGVRALTRGWGRGSGSRQAAWRTMVAVGLAAAVLGGCASPTPLTLVASSSDRQWTGVAATRGGRVFVSYPRWGGLYDNAVEELYSGRPVPFPNAAWNMWSPGDDPNAGFVCVQSVHTDAAGRVWVLDPASPRMEGVVPGGAKLVLIDAARNQVARIYQFGASIAPAESYLNDVRIDVGANRAYITDSGAGAIIVVNLRTGGARRVLADHPATRAEDTEIVIDGRPLRTASGDPLRVHADGIALDSANGWLYWQALTGRTLYRAPTRVLGSFQASDVAIAASVEVVGPSVVTDGMAMDEAGNLYFTAIERNAVMYRTPSGELRTLVSDPRLAWPDSIAIVEPGAGPGGRGGGRGGGGGGDGAGGSEAGYLLVTTSRIHQGARFSPDGKGPPGPYEVLRLPLAPRE